MARRVETTVDPSLDETFPARRYADVQIQTLTGKLISSGVTEAPGEPDDPKWAEIVDAKVGDLGLADTQPTALVSGPLAGRSLDELISILVTNRRDPSDLLHEGIVGAPQRRSDPPPRAFARDLGPGPAREDRSRRMARAALQLECVAGRRPGPRGTCPPVARGPGRLALAARRRSRAVGSRARSRLADVPRLRSCAGGATASRLLFRRPKEDGSWGSA